MSRAVGASDSDGAASRLCAMPEYARVLDEIAVKWAAIEHKKQRRRAFGQHIPRGVDVEVVVTLLRRRHPELRDVYLTPDGRSYLWITDRYVWGRPSFCKILLYIFALLLVAGAIRRHFPY